MKKKIGVVAAGHKETAKAAEDILRAGGNAFDAVVAAHLAACVAEPVLSSLGGGGFLLAYTSEGKSQLYDFFVQTPANKCSPEDTDFYPISADFGSAQQEFHIGRGSIATPGTVKGLFAVHNELCSMPMLNLAEPAIELARNGVVMNSFQAYILDIVQAIYLSTADSRHIFASGVDKQQLLQQGETLRQPEFAGFLDVLAREGEALFYQGEIAQTISQLCREGGGHLKITDLYNYEVAKRPPLLVPYRHATLLTNPPPSSGGMLIAFALKLLESIDLDHYQFGHANYLDLLAHVQGLTNKARIDANLDNTLQTPDQQLLHPEFVDTYRAQVKGRALCSRGTTHISVMDHQGNIASLTTSNGEGCGLIVPGTGICLNNMLGEEDLNPRGFHRWPLNQRMTSMMAPSIVFLPNDNRIALGSGGSNRIRTAILQVLVNLIDFKMSLDQAVISPRIHFESDLLSIEGDFDAAELNRVVSKYSNHKVWEQRNLFFGGAHSVSAGPHGFTGIGDPRRGGYSTEI